MSVMVFPSSFVYITIHNEPPESDSLQSSQSIINASLGYQKISTGGGGGGGNLTRCWSM